MQHSPSPGCIPHTHSQYQKEHLTFLEKFLSGDLMQFPIVKSLLLIVRAWESMWPLVRVCDRPHVSMHGLRMVRWGLQAYLRKDGFYGKDVDDPGVAMQDVRVTGREDWRSGWRDKKTETCVSVWRAAQKRKAKIACSLACTLSPFHPPFLFPSLSFTHFPPSLFLSLPHSQLLILKVVHPNKAKIYKEAHADEHFTFPQARCWRH